MYPLYDSHRTCILIQPAVEAMKFVQVAGSDWRMIQLHEWTTNFNRTIKKLIVWKINTLITIFNAINSQP